MDTAYSHIDVRLTTKGKYHWNISLVFLDEANIPDRIKKIDSKLKDLFPQNTSINIGSGRYSEVDPFEE